MSKIIKHFGPLDPSKQLRADELVHWKYIKKIKIGKGFRYFYTPEEVKAYYDKTKDKIAAKVDKTKDKIADKVEQHEKQTKYKKAVKRVEKIRNRLEKKREKEEKANKKEPKYKYVAKVEINGKYRYFYSQEEYDAYLKREEYQKDEPEFMKDFKKSEDPLTSFEDAVLVNPRYNPDDPNTDYEVNCAECTAIYELRRRGYDVESNGVSGEPNAIDEERRGRELENALKYNTEDRFNHLYENPKTVHPDGSYESLYNAINENPPGSRGDLSFTWSGDQAGHSVVWEKDTSGAIYVIDTQCSGKGNVTMYKLDDLYQYMGSYVSVTRTDNLKLKEDVTKICQSRTSKRTVPKPGAVLLNDDGYNYYRYSNYERKTYFPVLNEKKGGR